MNLGSICIVIVLIAATGASFFWGGFETLLPIQFLVGLFFVSAVSLWAASSIGIRKLLTLVVCTLAMATLDEYLHVSTGVYVYFDRAIPSPISVFGTSLLMILILAIATRLSKLHQWGRKKGLSRVLPALVLIVLQPVLVWVQGYLPILKWPVILLYVVMGVASLFYSFKRPLEWTFALMISGMVVGAAMESVGSLDGMWSFHFMELLPFFMITTWALRAFTVNASCLLLGVDFSSRND